MAQDLCESASNISTPVSIASLQNGAMEDALSGSDTRSRSRTGIATTHGLGQQIHQELG